MALYRTIFFTKEHRKLESFKKKYMQKYGCVPSKMRMLKILPKEVFEKKKTWKAHESLIIDKIILAAKNNTKNYLMKKEQNGQLNSHYLNYKDVKGNSALYYAAYYNSSDSIRILLKNGADPNLKCSNGNTPLHIAFKNNNSAIIGSLLYYGGNPETPNDDNETPLFFAIPRTAEKYGLRKGLVYNCD